MSQITGDEPFTDLFKYAAGESEVPPQFIFWTSLSLLAACVENRVWMERFAYKRIFPNLYTFLIGRSGAGKGHAIGLTQRIMKQMEQDGRGCPPAYRGSLTRAAIHDEMATDEGQDSSPLFFICPELGDSIGAGQVAKDLIKFMTDIWEGDIPSHQERTRTRGKNVLRDPCLNCLAGTTPEWCREVIDLTDLNSGFWARVVCVIGERDYAKRVYKPDTSGWAETVPWLSWRLSLLLGAGCEGDLELRGQMILSPEAEQLDEEWYMNRPDPRSLPNADIIASHWSRQHDMVWKIAMLLKLGDYYDLRNMQQGDESWRVIGPEHIFKAQQLSTEVMESAGDFTSQAINHHYNGPGAEIEKIIQRLGEVKHRPDLVRRAAKLGVNMKALDKILEGLEDQNVISRHFWGNDNITIRWKG